MSGDLYIESLHHPKRDPDVYHDPQHGVFHCHYVDEQMEYFGTSWFYVDVAFVRRRGRYAHRIPPSDVRWLYSYLKDREPSPLPNGKGGAGVFRRVASKLAKSGAAVYGIEMELPRLSPEERERLIAWRDELCAFLSLAIERNEPVYASL